jgi:hypothetical protein
MPGPSVQSVREVLPSGLLGHRLGCLVVTATIGLSKPCRPRVDRDLIILSCESR